VERKLKQGRPGFYVENPNSLVRDEADAAKRFAVLLILWE
jgi:hypothetical protein